MESFYKPLGATITPNGVFYRVWAPKISCAEVEIRHTTTTNKLQLTRDEDGFHTGFDPEGRPGDAYLYYLDGEGGFPDPASRAQQIDVHGPSLVVDPSIYQWKDAAWKRPLFRDLVIYELHIGTFTQRGTFRAAIERLPFLRDLGITAIEIMPVADFPGQHNWGYDGVLIYAPARCYGSPDDFRALIDHAHQLDIAVILDVVYNHFGPDGNYLTKYSPYYFNDEHHTPWGSAFNFDAKESSAVREFFRYNPVYWMEEFHVDGFRLDATHQILDCSRTHILAEITEGIHSRGGYAIAEDPKNDARMITPCAQNGFGFDAVWADDFHHIMRVGQTHEQAAYFQDFKGSLQEAVSALQHGWLFRGQLTKTSHQPRGTECAHRAPQQFVHCISNHDQTGNRAFGERLHQLIQPAAYRALSALLCLSPYTPLLFMGQEWAASSPFLFFTDHNSDLGKKVTEGRRQEFASFPEFADAAARNQIPDPQDDKTFERSKLNWDECCSTKHAHSLLLYITCLQLRREIPALRPTARDTWHVEELPWGVGAIRLNDTNGVYLLIFNLKGNHHGFLTDGFASPPLGKRWNLLFSTEDPRFGGAGINFNFETQFLSLKQPEVVLLKA